MTFIVPNYFLEEQPHNVISSDSIFTVTYSSKRSNEKIAIRNITHVMILLVEGAKRLKFKEEELKLQEGSIFFLAQGNYFMSEVVSEGGKYEAIMVYFDDKFILDFVKKYEVDLATSHEKRVVTFSSSVVLKLLVDSYPLYLNQVLERKNEIIKLKTEEIFLHLLSEKGEQFRPFLKGIVNSSKDRLKYILEANIDMIESVDDMCKLTRVSREELRKEMKKSFGMQPKAWLDSKRLEQASQLLTNSDETIASIATTCGYSTLSWFGVQFKKAYGVTPKVYREQNR